MIRKSTLFFRTVSFATVFGLVNLSMPAGAIATIGAPIKDAVQRKLHEKEAERNALAKRLARSASRPLSLAEQNHLQGSTGENPYLAGQNKWDVVYKGVNLMTGNYTTTATDLSFDGGYGIPVNVTRSYSANSIDEGPFGKGWTLSADVRSTAGGILKSPGAPVRSVPTVIKERPSTQLSDPNVVLPNGDRAAPNDTSTQPAAAVISTDAGGQEETIQKDLDGILTTPPWDKNTSDPVYEWVPLNGSTYQVLVSNKVTTPDGTVYLYSKHGKYPNGTVPWNDSSAPAEAANVLKVDSATDRNGNTTTYFYSTDSLDAANDAAFTGAIFQKSNGKVWEQRLMRVHMPNGHEISFDWKDSPTHLTNRIHAVSDNSVDGLSKPRTVGYAYDSSGQLTSVTTPEGRVTTYGYGSLAPAGILSSITDPRGLQTRIYSQVASAYYGPYGVSIGSGVLCTGVMQPNGQWFAMNYSTGGSAGAGATVREGTSTPFTGSWNGQAYEYGFTVILQGYQGAVYVTRSYLPQGSYYTAAEMGYAKFDPARQDQLQVVSYDFSHFDRAGTLSLLGATRSMLFNSYSTRVQVSTEYNFLGNKLWEQTREYDDWVQPPSGAEQHAPLRAATVLYAYWGADKYYQQKAVVDQAGRIAFTDYYDSSGKKPSYSEDSAAYLGSKGQTYRVYDAMHAAFVNNAGQPISFADGSWRYEIHPQDPGTHSAEFAYDEHGRPTDISKLQSTSTNPWTYVQTHTSYGTDLDGSWGQATEVVEDYGGINRTTHNNGYTSWGKANNVTDAAERIFITDFDKDGNVRGVTCDGTPVVTYTYGTSGITNGQVTAVVDNLSGIEQDIAYTTSGGGLGQPLTITEKRGGSIDNVVTYAYSATGDRASATYTTYSSGVPSHTVTWQYSDYIPLGDPTKPSRVFQTLKTSSFDAQHPEQIFYAYDSAGRLVSSAFAQSDTNAMAAHRALAVYTYDPAGRLTSLTHYWQNLSNGQYGSNPEAVLTDACTYEIGGSMNRGLKTSSQVTYRTATGGALAQLQAASYGYDAQLDTLTSATYGDGISPVSQSWSYDAAGNRNDAVTDNLNRATSIGGVTCTNDILGNRVTKGTATYGWDVLNRMTSYASGGITTSYAYRGDGMRVSKSDSTGSVVYRYDGQMLMQDVETPTSGTQTLTDYGLGARGVDAVFRTANGTTDVGYPIYDAHGNRVATLTKNGTSFSLTDIRSFDAWGNVRVGAQTGRPRARYCANLGHVQDDESSLVYMRARYYEPSSGRFVSEDPAGEEPNACAYARNDPVNKVDSSGGSALDLVRIALQWLSNSLFVAGVLAKLNGNMRKLDALMNTITGFLKAMQATISMCQAAMKLDKQQNPGLGDAFEVVLNMQGWLMMEAVSYLWAAANLNWFIELQSDPDISLPESFNN